MPDAIHDRLRTLENTPSYSKILEHFYMTMIKMHKIRSELYHTELAKIYLKKVMAGSSNDIYNEFNGFIRDPNAKYFEPKQIRGN